MVVSYKALHLNVQNTFLLQHTGNVEYYLDKFTSQLREVCTDPQDYIGVLAVQIIPIVKPFEGKITARNIFFE
jgi:hypothetical protein